MSKGTDIEWADHTWNPTSGCDEVSPGCDNCYARVFTERFKGVPGHYFEGGFAVQLREDKLGLPFTWKTGAKVFVNSTSDLLHASVPDAYVAKVFAVMALTPQHTYQLLTKRHGRLKTLLNDPAFWRTVGREARHLGYHYKKAANHLGDGRNIYDTAVWEELRFLPNVWIGVSVEDQKRADLRIPFLLDTPAAVRWLSIEPLLGPVDLDLPRCDDHGRAEVFTDDHGREWCGRCSGDGFTGELSFGHWLNPLNGGIGWIVVGGESGHGARPMHPAWARTLRDQAVEAGVPFFFKQWGAWAPRGRLSDDGPLPVDNKRTLILNEGGGVRGIAAGSLTNRLATFSDGSHCEVMERVGKKESGHLLDGRLWREFPELAAA